MTARYLVADVFDGLATLEDGSVDLVVTSPPFLALRSYLPADDPLKSKEIGSEPTPAAFLDVMLAFTAELRRVLAPHGSIAIELGDTYSSADQGEVKRPNDAGKRYNNHNPELFQGSDTVTRVRGQTTPGGAGWPLAKSKTLIPELFRIALAYGINPLTGAESPAGQWRIRNVVTWARPNPPVGALGDKWRPATSDVVVACVSGKRYWDDLATRKAHTRPDEKMVRRGVQNGVVGDPNLGRRTLGDYDAAVQSPSGAPLLDYWEIPLLDPDEEPTRYGPKEKPAAKPRERQNEPAMKRGGNWDTFPNVESTHEAGTPLLDYWVIPPGGYEGSHYAVFPPELVVPLVKAMCPERVCRECGEPSRRIHLAGGGLGQVIREAREAKGLTQKDVAAWFPSATGGLTGCVWNWENEANVPMADQWETLKATLGIGTQWDHLIPQRDAVEYEHVSDHPSGWTQDAKGKVYQRLPARMNRITPEGWTDCGHNNYRPGLVLDPFAGSGTTLLVATGHGHDAIGIDLDQRNAELAMQRVGPFLLEVQ